MHPGLLDHDRQDPQPIARQRLGSQPGDNPADPTADAA